ncbi:MAG TPA: shikimate kinase, partial [Caulobacteraceae bacterium]
LGKSLAPALGRTLIDLDEVFLARLGDIGAFIQDEGYAAYKASNSKLAAGLVDEATSPALLVTSSGFLTHDNPPDVLVANRALLARGYSISVMPSSSIDHAVATIVTRQMGRPYNEGVGMEAHAATARARFETYMTAGDLLVCSTAPPDVIVSSLHAHMS